MFARGVSGGGGFIRRRAESPHGRAASASWRWGGRSGVGVEPPGGGVAPGRARRPWLCPVKVKGNKCPCGHIILVF